MLSSDEQARLANPEKDLGAIEHRLVARATAAATRHALPPSARQERLTATASLISEMAKSWQAHDAARASENGREVDALVARIPDLSFLDSVVPLPSGLATPA